MWAPNHLDHNQQRDDGHDQEDHRYEFKMPRQSDKYYAIHRLLYKKSSKLYDDLLQGTEVIPGTFTSGGTIANITGL